MTPSIPADRTVRSSFMLYTPARDIVLYTPPTMCHTEAGRAGGKHGAFGSRGC
jgi:hypothetical protein